MNDRKAKYEAAFIAIVGGSLVVMFFMTLLVTATAGAAP